MPYFDAIAGGNFKQADGQWCFYPWGPSAAGYVLPSEDRYLEARHFVARQLQIGLPIVALMALLAGLTPYLLLLLPALLTWYAIGARRLTRGLSTTPVRLTRDESRRTVAAAHTVNVLWLIELGAVLFVAAGIGLRMRQPDEWFFSWIVIGFFGVSALSVAVAIAGRLRRPA